ncbi:PP2C family serine/threonine-protein phosphatase [Rahnella perminowiae]|uniref:PP2C family protein-serine/threonine phosphatase n=1 Tax=Rahnella perminowiae TaxID=2816244 RepID=UPI00364BD562
MFTERLANWLARSSANRSINQPIEINAVLSSDIGLVRNENQDVIAAMRVNTPTNAGKSFVAMALLDGMGGMQDGKQCASIALSTFFFSLIRFRSAPLESRLKNAVLEANDAVYKFANGQGGSTLSAIIIEHGSSPVTVNVGDSRIYSFNYPEGLKAVSSDDSLEALGGRGRGLLQFIGMGESIKPHIKSLEEKDSNIILTSDGTHFISQEAFQQILLHSPNFKVSAQRIAEYVRWCGAHDNASFGYINCEDIKNNLINHKEIGVELWDPFGNLHIMWMKNYPSDQNYFSQNIVDDPENKSVKNTIKETGNNALVNEGNIDNKKTEESQGDLFVNEAKKVKSSSTKAVKSRKPRAKKAIGKKENEDNSVMINISSGENNDD